MLKCSKEAFAACPDRHLCGCPEESVFTEGSECDMFNRQIMEKPMTHADQIRAMRDEELAKLPTDNTGGFDCGECLEDGMERCTMECGKRCLAWLQQPAEVSGDA